MDKLLTEKEMIRHMARLNVARNYLEEEFISMSKTGDDTNPIEAMLADLDAFVQENKQELDRILDEKGEQDSNMDVDNENKKRALDDDNNDDDDDSMDQELEDLLGDYDD
ncbi:hypothetical protein SEMRO_3250_G345860.1 [Seminavis robusta]|uniref:Uncharacterized protein n=1 Tax=Seminavis robusta TaxID=568900 RepID=A0A9N8F1F5_9STRA|nr:hypothetical protein SEMRO_3250_G345860.1 [Seminavis robusta]|eukprot:Sro3250_g345860.1 n/a (110) ;mRNA; f:4150-4479